MKHEFADRRGTNTLTSALVDWLACALFRKTVEIHYFTRVSEAYKV
jgi:hypothetical protein